MDVEFPSPDVGALLCVLRGLGGVSLHGPLPPACASPFPHFSAPFPLRSLANHLGLQSCFTPRLLEPSAEGCVEVWARGRWLREAPGGSRGGRKACFCHRLISHHALFCPSQQGKLAHAEVCATAGEVFPENQLLA